MSWDVVVWGGGTGGTAAAIQASRSGANTLLLTPGPWLGGMLSAAGVCAPDGHEISCWQTGLWGQFIRALSKRVPQGLDQNWVSCFGFRPEQAEQLLQDWVKAEPQLSWWSGCRLQDVNRNGDRINSLVVEHDAARHRLEAKQWIDGSDLGDLIAQAEAPFRWGWESRESWNEPSAPPLADLETDSFFSEQPVQSPTWVVMGQLNGAGPVAGHGDPPASPFQEALNTFGLERTITYGRLPGDLVMLNWPLHGNDWHHDLARSIDPLRQRRDDLGREMREHSVRFLEELCRCSNGWLTPGSAFPTNTPHLALMPYWREGRRLTGRAVVTERDLLPVAPTARRGPLMASSVAVGTYANDHHYPGEDWPLAPKSCLWGGRWTGTPFCIPYEALLSVEISNLIAAEKCFSVSHMANGATRLQPLILNIGQAAGLAAALASRQNISPHDLPSAVIQRQLISDRWAPAAVLPIWDWPGWHPAWQDAQARGLQNPDAVRVDGSLDPQVAGDLARPQADQAPLEPHAQTIHGHFRCDHDRGTYQLERSEGATPLITLEPGVKDALDQLDDGRDVQLIAVENPWGPWWRVIQVLT